MNRTPTAQSQQSCPEERRAGVRKAEHMKGRTSACEGGRVSPPREDDLSEIQWERTVAWLLVGISACLSLSGIILFTRWLF